MARPQPAHNLAEAATVAYVEALGKLAAQETQRTMVRDAGAVSPLVALLVSGTGQVPGMVASVLRDLAQHAGNRDTIVECNGVPPLVRMLEHESRVVAGEAADALRSLAHGSLSVCSLIRADGGVKLLVRLIKEGVGAEEAAQATGASRSAMQAVGAVSCIAEADAASLQDMCDAGGIGVLVTLLAQGFDAGDAAAARQRGSGGMGGWAQSKPVEATSRALVLFSSHHACLRRMLEARVIAHLVRILLWGLHSPAAAHAAAVLVRLLTEFKDDAMAQTLDALLAAKKDELRADASGAPSPGW